MDKSREQHDAEIAEYSARIDEANKARLDRTIRLDIVAQRFNKMAAQIDNLKSTLDEYEAKMA